MSEKLTNEEYRLLREALEAWSQLPLMSAAVSATLITVLGGKDDKPMTAKLREEIMAEAKVEGERRKEQGTLLAARLIQLRDAGEIERVAGGQP